jgi:hypothetical protein
MSLDYYLLCSENYNQIITNLENIIQLYENICYNTYLVDDLDINYLKIFQTENNCDFFINKLSHMKQLKKICDDKIFKICKHEFVNDTIDITPDTSKNITYCKICGLTE